MLASTRRWQAALVGFALLGLFGCSNGAKATGNTAPPSAIDAGPTGPAAVADCDKLRDHIAGIYQRAQPVDINAAKQERRNAVTKDNVSMVIADCRKDPPRFAPCIKAAVSVSQLERDCLIKLDDDGSVEGRHFSTTP